MSIATPLDVTADIRWNLCRQQHFYPAEDSDTATFLCGPPGLIEKAAVPALKELGFEEGKTIFGF